MKLVIAVAFLVPGQAFLASAQSYTINTIAGGGTASGAPSGPSLTEPQGLALDSVGNLYIADHTVNVIWKLTPGGTLSVFAGTAGKAGYSGDGGPATSGLLNQPFSEAFDSAGDLYITDFGNNCVREVTPDGIIHTFAGPGVSGVVGDGGPPASARLNGPRGIAVGVTGIIFISEYNNNRVRMVSGGIIQTIVNQNNSQAGYSGDGGSPALATLNYPEGLAVDTKGNLYIADNLNNCVRKVTPANSQSNAYLEYDLGTITTVASNLSNPTHVATDAGGDLFIVDTFHSRIVEITASGATLTYAGTGQLGNSGDGGLAVQAQLNLPTGVVVDANGNVYISDRGNDNIRKVTPAGTISTISTATAPTPATALATSLQNPKCVALDAGGNLYVVDDRALYKVAIVSGQITKLASPLGPAPSTVPSSPDGCLVDPLSNVYVADFYNAVVRKISPTGEISIVAGTVGVTGFKGDGGPATGALLNHPTALALDGAGNLYIADNSNARVRKVTPDGVITTIAGTGTFGVSGDGGPATMANLGAAYLALDSVNNLYVADVADCRVRIISPAGIINTFAGSGCGYGGDGGPATSALLGGPWGLAVDGGGKLYISDPSGDRIRRVDGNGIITTIAGNGTAGFSGDGGNALSAELHTPSGIAVDLAGDVYIVDAANNRVREAVPSVKAASLTIVSGNNQPGSAGTELPQPLTVKLLGTDGNPYAGDDVIFAVTSGSATLTPSAPRPTAADGMASASVTLGNKPGPVIVTAGVGGLAAVSFSLGVIPAAVTIVSGNQQSGTVGTTLSQNLVVKVTGTDMNPFAGATVTFAVASGSATLKPPSQPTAADGTASTSVTLGATAGPVTITASVTGLPTVTFSLTARAPQNLPQISAGGVVSAALSTPPVQIASPNAILSIFGQNFAPAGTSRAVSGGDLVNGLLPTNLTGVCVTFGSQRTPIFLVTPGQLNVQAPQLPAPGTVNVQVLTGCDTPQESVSSAVAMTVQAAAPEFFYASHSTTGQNPVAAIDGVTGGGIGDPARLGPGFALAYPGEIVQIYATGLGLTNPPFSPGQLPQGAAQVSGVTVSLDGSPLDPSAIQYAGVAPLNAGLYQLNVVLPASLAAGDHAVTMAVNGSSSPAGSYISVGAPPAAMPQLAPGETFSSRRALLGR